MGNVQEQYPLLAVWYKTNRSIENKNKYHVSLIYVIKLNVDRKVASFNHGQLHSKPDKKSSFRANSRLVIQAALHLVN